MKRLLGNLPLLVSVCITVVFSAETPIFRPLKTEASFGFWVVILVPLAIALVIVQIFLWILWPWTRPIGRA